MKEAIAETALQQFLKCGIRTMTIQKLVAPLHISTKTVYKYFKNKEDLLADALNLFYAQQAALIAEASATENPVRYLYYIWFVGIESEYRVNKDFYYDLHHFYPALHEKVLVKNSEKFLRPFKQIITRGMEAGMFRDDIYPEVVIEGLALLYSAITRTTKFTKYKLTPYEVMLNTVDVFIRGICTNQGVAELDEVIQYYRPQHAQQ